MKTPWLCSIVALAALCPLIGRMVRSAPEPQPEPHRSPMDVVVLAGGRLALTANHTSSSASLVDLVEGKVLAEQSCGRKPAAVAASPDGRRAAVSNLWAGTLSLLEVQGATLRPAGSLEVGSLPRGLVFAPD